MVEEMTSTSMPFNGLTNPSPLLSTSAPLSNPMILSLGEQQQQQPLTTYFFQGDIPGPIVPTLIEQSSTTPQHTPCVATVLRNLVQKQGQEIKDVVEGTIPRVAVGQPIKKTFRDFYHKETLSIFQFLDSPLTPLLQRATQVVKRFGRADYSANRVKIKDLLLDCACTPYLAVLNSVFQKPSTDVSGWVQQTRGLIDAWRSATTELQEAEYQLNRTLTTFTDIHQKVKAILLLPEAEGYDQLMNAFEEYVKGVFKTQMVEESYKTYIEALKKVSVLTDSLSAIRAIVNTPVEPLCSVCILEPVCITSVPCGHTFCQQCGNRQTLTCYVCRSPVKDRMRIYLS
jgi:hypothetical protein